MILVESSNKLLTLNVFCKCCVCLMLGFLTDLVLNLPSLCTVHGQIITATLKNVII